MISSSSRLSSLPLPAEEEELQLEPSLSGPSFVPGTCSRLRRNLSGSKIRIEKDEEEIVWEEQEDGKRLDKGLEVREDKKDIKE